MLPLGSGAMYIKAPTRLISSHITRYCSKNVFVMNGLGAFSNFSKSWLGTSTSFSFDLTAFTEKLVDAVILLINVMAE